MLFANIKIQTRQNHLKPSKSKLALKSKSSLPEQGSGVTMKFQHLKLTQSHQIQQVALNQFQLNIIAPNQKPGQSELVTKRFACPDWIAVSHMTASFQEQLKQKAQNPEVKCEDKLNTCDEYSNSNLTNQETERKIDNFTDMEITQYDRIMQITGCQNLQISNMHISRNMQDLQSKSAFILQQPSEDSDKGSIVSFNLENPKNKSMVAYKVKSVLGSDVKSQKQLQELHKQEFQKLSEYGLKPCQSKRLKKIQNMEKIQMFSNQKEDQEVGEFQQYFNISKAKKTNQQMKKVRKCSAIVESNNIGKRSLSKRSQSKQKHSLSKKKTHGLDQCSKQVNILQKVCKK